MAKAVSTMQAGVVEIASPELRSKMPVRMDLEIKFCPSCGESVERDPIQRIERFICTCGWRSWYNRVEELQAAIGQRELK